MEFSWANDLMIIYMNFKNVGIKLVLYKKFIMYLFWSCFTFITEPFTIRNVIFFQRRITDKIKKKSKYLKRK